MGLVERDIVHKTGLYHKNVQVNIIHKGKLLLQERSSYVDIAKGCCDQSLATHLLKGEGVNGAIKRGLKDELGIKTTCSKLHYIAGPVKIVKRYKYDKSLYNREFVYLYKVDVYPKPKLVCPKIKRLFWKPIKEVIEDVKNNPDKYTQTFQMWVRKGIIC